MQRKAWFQKKRLNAAVEVGICRTAVPVMVSAICCSFFLAGSAAFSADDSISPEVKASLEKSLKDYAEVVCSLPHHPCAAIMLNDLLSVISEEKGTSRADSALLLAAQYEDSDLGLYAVDSLLSETRAQEDAPAGEISAKVSGLFNSRPNARVGCLSFDRMLGGASDTRQFCLDRIKEHPDTRLAVLAKVRLAEWHAARGELPTACEWFLDVLQSPRNEALRDLAWIRLNRLWNQCGQWMGQVLLPSMEYVSGTPRPVLARFLEYVRMLGDISRAGSPEGDAAFHTPWPANRTALDVICSDEGGNVSMRMHAHLTLCRNYARNGNVEPAVKHIEQAGRLFAARPSDMPAHVEVALAAFLMDTVCPGKERIPSSIGNAIQGLLLAGRFETARRSFLDAIMASIGQLTPDEQIYFLLRVAERHEKGGDVPAAAATLRTAFSIGGGSDAFRQKVGQQLARIQLTEYYDRWQPSPSGEGKTTDGMVAP